MKTLFNKIQLALFFLMITFSYINAQVNILDEFETREGWSFIKSDGVDLHLTVEKGLTGNAIRLDYDFTKGTGYGGIQKNIPVDLPDNYEFTFYLKAESPPNNFEIKFIDSTGNNVWWMNNRNYDFPEGWKKIRIRKRHISFAWGPTSDKDLRRIDRIEFTIASFVGGKGTVWIDNLTFKALPPEQQDYPIPSVTASSSLKNHMPGTMTDHSLLTAWESHKRKHQEITVDFKTRREFGGLHIQWLKEKHAESFDVHLSDDGKRWEKVYSVTSNRSHTSFIRLPETEARFVRINLLKSASGNRYGIAEIQFPDIMNSLTMNDFFSYVARHSPYGDYPRYFSGQASYWTITGVNSDTREALLNEDGMVEVEKGRFSIEPMIRIDNTLYNWSNVTSLQSLGGKEECRDLCFIPSVTWNCSDLRFTTRVASVGEANKHSRLTIGYSFENVSQRQQEFEFYLLIRPFQVNPSYQFLNMPGGTGKIHSIREEEGRIVVDDKLILPRKRYEAFGALPFDEGNMVELIRNGMIPSGLSVTDPNGLAQGILKYSLSLKPAERTEIILHVPYYEDNTTIDKSKGDAASDDFYMASDYWRKKTGHIKFRLPASADRIINTYRSMLIYILINRDRAGIQPGSRSYERSWIRDGALTSSALLKSGIVSEVREFIDRYTAHQYENGKVPCVVDFRGPDPVPENDSNGELIYLIREFFNFTKDTGFLRSKNKNVLSAVQYIESLIAERSTDHYKYGNDSVRAFYGLVPESISHEGYSAKPMHSYWDNFFTLKGLKDATEIQRILGEKESYERIKGIRDTFRENLYRSIHLAMKTRHIDYIPGCVELGDFDATSTTIALTPCNELINMPKPQVYNTFEKYYEYFRNRRDGTIDWVNYTPYEHRLIGSFIMLDQPERAHELMEFFLNDQRPQGWNHWAEVVWNDPRTPQFIGDMPHTWVGSDFINAVRSMFVYENEVDQTLVLAPALYQEWIDADEGMSVENLPTYYGDISYTIKKDHRTYRFSISGNVSLPANGIKIRNMNRSQPPVRVTINGSDTREFSEKEITVRACPAEVMIYY